MLTESSQLMLLVYEHDFKYIPFQIYMHIYVHIYMHIYAQKHTYLGCVHVHAIAYMCVL